MELLSNFFEYKIAALLHDPVDKAWLLIKGENHEEVARRYAYEILSSVGLSERVASILSGVKELRMRHPVGYADAIASSIDRWVISILTTFKDTNGNYRYISGVFKTQRADVLKNIIDPRFCIKLERPPKESIEKFIKELNKLLSIGKGDIRLIYHLLYSLYEPVFYKFVKGRDFVGSIADTRAPTHTVFDHSYATASIVNLTFNYGELIEGKDLRRKLEGYVVVVDLAGIQKFINASRKLRDLWVSSWFSSALAWSVVWPFIYALGPDIMVSPSPRNNPFYYASILSILKSKHVNVDDIKRYFQLAVGHHNIEVPRFGVMPTQVILLLPSLKIVLSGLSEILNDEAIPKHIRDVIRQYANVGNEEPLVIAKLIVDIYKGAWKAIVEEVRDQLFSGSAELLQFLRKVLFEYNCWGNELNNVFKLIKDYPPLPIRVSVVSVKEVLTSLGGSIEDYEVYDVLINRALEELKKASLVKYVYPPLTPIEEIYEYVRRTSSKACGEGRLSMRGFEFCSVCGVTPAVLRMPPADEKWYEGIEGLRLYVIESFISPGERLCIYDLIKRILSINEVFNKVVKKLISNNIGSINLRSFPSTSHVALADFYDGLKEAYATAKKANMLNELEDKVLNVVEKLLKIRPTFKKSLIMYRYLENLKNSLRGELGEEYERISFEVVINFLEPEVHILSVEGRKALRKLLRFIEERLGIHIPLRAYFTIIRADADNMGKLLSGDTTSLFPQLTPKDYLVNALEGGIRNIVELVINGNNAKAVSELEAEYKGKVPSPKNIAKENISRLTRLLRRSRIPLTPTYHATISRSLMIISLLDQYIIESNGGFIVYSGGDDLLAIAPVSSSLPIILKSRRVFSIGHYEREHNYKGFLSKDLLEKVGITSYIVPLIVTGGRSYSAVYMHYRYPLYVGLSLSRELLEKKNEIYWVVSTNKLPKYSKDLLTLSYLPRGYEALTIVVPFKYRESYVVSNNYWVGDVVEMMYNAWKDIEDGLVSKSVIYDLLKEIKTLIELMNRDEELYRKFISYIVSRNARKSNIKNLIKLLSDYLDLKVVRDHSEEVIVLNLINFLRLYKSALGV